MSIEDRLRNHLRDDAEAIVVSGAGATTVAATARRRSRRRWAAGSLASLLAIGGLAAVALDQPDDPTSSVDTEAVSPLDDGAGDTGDTGFQADADTTDDTGDPTPAPTPSAVDAAVDDIGPEGADGLQSTQSFVAVNAMVSIGDGVVAWLPGPGGGLWFSADLESWEAVADPRPSPEAYVSDIAAHDGWLYAWGAEVDGGTPEPWAARTDDRVTWQAIDIGLDVPAATGAAGWSTQLYSIAAGPAGAVATGESFVHLDIAALTGREEGTFEWSLGDPTGNLGVLVLYDPGTGDELEVIDLAAVLDAETLAVIAGTGSTPRVSVADDGIDFADTSDSAALSAPLTTVAALADGFAGALFDPSIGGDRLMVSDDGAEWRELAISVADAPDAARIGALAESTLVATADGPVLTFQVGTGDNWTETRVDTLLGDHADHQLVRAAFGPGGYVAVVVGSDPDEGTATAPPAPVSHTADGHTVVVDQASGLVTVTDDRSDTQVASFPYLALETAPPSSEQPPGLPDNIVAVPGGIQVLDDSGAVVADLSGLDNRLAEASSSGLGTGVVPSGDPDARWYVVTTTDGLTWTVVDHALVGDPAFDVIRAVAVHGDDALVMVERMDGRGLEVAAVPLA